MRRRVISVLVSLAFCLSMVAETYVVVMKEVLGSDFDFALSGWKYQGLTFITDMGANKMGTKPGYYASKGEVRLYPFNTLTIKFEKEITSVQFQLSEAGIERLPEIAVSSGEIEHPDANPLCWVGCDKEITFTVGEIAVYGSSEYHDNLSGQLDFLSITLTTKGPYGPDSGNTDPDALYDPSCLPCESDNIQYYTLQGVKIPAPTSGLPCIAIINGKAHKIFNIIPN